MSGWKLLKERQAQFLSLPFYFTENAVADKTVSFADSIIYKNLP